MIRQVGSEPIDTWEELSLALAGQAAYTFARLRVNRAGQQRIVKLWISPDAVTPAEYARANRAPAAAYQAGYRGPAASR